MRVLATGSEGFLMQATIPRLQEAGHEVVGVDNLSKHGAVDRDRDYEFIKGDLTEIDVARQACQDVDAVVQSAAAAFGVVKMHEHPADLLHNDIVLHANVLKAAVEANVDRVAYISSSMLYEQCETSPMAEEDPLGKPAPDTEFGLSKFVGERMFEAFRDQYGLDYTIWRPFNILAPGEQAKVTPGHAHVYADFIKKIVIDQQDPVEIIGDGEQVRSFVWEDDLAQAIVDHSFNEETNGEVYNVAGSDPLTMKELATMIFERGQALGLIPGNRELAFDHKPAPDADIQRLVPSIDKAREELGWEPSMPLEKGIEICIRQAVAEHPEIAKRLEA